MVDDVDEHVNPEMLAVALRGPSVNGRKQTQYIITFTFRAIAANLGIMVVSSVLENNHLILDFAKGEVIYQRPVLNDYLKKND